MQALKKEVDDEPGAGSRRVCAARERAARQREQRVSDALRTLERIEQAGAPKKGKQQAQLPEPATAGDANDHGSAASKNKPAKTVRTSTTDPEARVMNMADGGFRPAFNGQLAVDTATQIITAVALDNVGSDMNQMPPMLQ